MFLKRGEANRYYDELADACGGALSGCATRDAVRLIANLKAYRRAHGAYPELIDVFGAKDMIVEPFTGGRRAGIIFLS